MQLSKTSHYLIHFLNTINFFIESDIKVNSYEKNIFETLKRVYKNKIKVDVDETSLSNSNVNIKLKIIEYIATNKSLLINRSMFNSDLEYNENNNFLTYFDIDKIDYNDEWLNTKGDFLNKFIFNLIINNYLPNELLDSIRDKNLYGDFVSLDILNSIEKIKKNALVKTIDNKLNLSINYNNLPKQKLKLIIKRCLVLSNLHNIDKSLYITVWLTKNKKKISDNSEVLGPKEINSGVTTIYDNHRDLTIFREEELNKVIIHELIHYLDLDFKSYNTIIFSNYFNIAPNIEIKLFESYTETCTCIINSMLCSIECNGDYKMFRRFLNYETKYNLFQTAKILVYYGFDSINDFVKPYENDKFKQTTSVFSYFFVKTALLYNYKLLLEFIKRNTVLFKFKNKKMNIERYNRLVLKCVLDKKYLKNLNDLMYYIKSNKIPDKIYKSMMMTCISL